MAIKRRQSISTTRPFTFTVKYLPPISDRIRQRKGIFSNKFCIVLLLCFSIVWLIVANIILPKEKGTWEADQQEWLCITEPVVQFRPVALMEKMDSQARRMEVLRSELNYRVRRPRLALVVKNMEKNSQALMLLTIVKALEQLKYRCTVYALEGGEALSSWTHAGCQVSALHSEISEPVDWANYEGVILGSLEVKGVIKSLSKHPFSSVPLIWLIQEDIFGKRLPYYVSSSREDLVSTWKDAFRRANVVVFPDFYLPMNYSQFGTGNFYVIPGSPINVWEAESYAKSHHRRTLRKENGISDGDKIIVVIGSNFFYDTLPCEFEDIVRTLMPNINGSVSMRNLKGRKINFKFIFLWGDSSSNYNSSLQELTSNVGISVDRVKLYGMDNDVNKVLYMSDLVIYGSFHEEQSFPSLLVRAMSFKLPIVVPNLDIITKNIKDSVHGLIFDPRKKRTLVNAFAQVFANIGDRVAASGKSLSGNMLAEDCVAGYAKLLEYALQFPSDVLLPLPASLIKQSTWAWDLLEEENNLNISVEYSHRNLMIQKGIIADFLEEKQNGYQANYSNVDAFPTQFDWDILTELQILEDSERLEREELADRKPRNLGTWNAVYNDARKAEKSNMFETSELDDDKIEKIGQQLCIYEVYEGEGAWPFLHHGPLYHGVALFRQAHRPRTVSEDLLAASMLPTLLGDERLIGLLCEFSGMFSVANMADRLQNLPWIGFQSWHAAGKEMSLSIHAEEVLETIAREKSVGDAVYYWVTMDKREEDYFSRDKLDFWSICNIYSSQCSIVFEKAFRLMYELPEGIAALPPMPGGEYWSTLHSWVMPTPSFLEFMMFARLSYGRINTSAALHFRLFLDSLDALNQENNASDLCILGSSDMEKTHCYCRVLELLVNVWAYHSARTMVFIDPNTGITTEKHTFNQRKGKMWIKYFNSTLLKSIEDDLLEEIHDNMLHSKRLLWSLTGKVG